TRSRTEPVDPRLAALADHRLVIAESPAAAVAAVRSGVPRAAVWLFTIPPERAVAGEPASWAADLREVTPEIGGLITDSLDSAGILERVAGPVHTVVFPPIAVDRPCEECRPAEGVDAFPIDVPGHLALWRALSVQESPVALPYSYPVARFRGEDGPWLPAERPGWDFASRGEPSHAPNELPTQSAWTVAAQLDGARALLADLPTGGPAAPAAGEQALRVRVFGHDMKFMRELATRLGSRPDLDVVVDEWGSAGAKNDGITENLARSAQVLVAEWARPNAIWLSRNKRDDQRLIVRFHRFEIESDYPRRIDIDAVDSVVYIAPLMARRIVEELGWPKDKLVYIPNYVDLARLDRPKFDGARFSLGMVGIVPGLKRFDLALDLLAAVRREDPRFSLLVRSQHGWAHKPSWDQARERRELQACLERVEKDPLLRGAVVFDAFGRDMAAWYRKVGHILSLSDVEGSHQGLTEGMGSGAVPVLRGWAGAAEAYGPEWVSTSLDDAVARVLANADADVWSEQSARAKADVHTRFDQQAVVEAWSDLVAGDVRAARARFERFA
ncbi:MAG TPA: hypothetical protein VI076_07805, partial [Actinopolymorphaceae bacterium]